MFKESLYNNYILIFLENNQKKKQHLENLKRKFTHSFKSFKVKKEKKYKNKNKYKKSKN